VIYQLEDWGVNSVTTDGGEPENVVFSLPKELISNL